MADLKLRIKTDYTDEPWSNGAQIAEYEAWAGHYAIAGCWRWSAMMESTLWLSDRRPMLWVCAYDETKPGHALGYVVVAFDAVSAAFELERHKAAELAPKFALGLSFYVRASYRRRGVGQALWRATCDWLMRHAPAADHVVFEPPAKTGREVHGFRGFFRVPRNEQWRALVFLPVRPDAELGEMASLLTKLEDTFEADITLRTYGDA